MFFSADEMKALYTAVKHGTAEWRHKPGGILARAPVQDPCSFRPFVSGGVCSTGPCFEYGMSLVCKGVQIRGHIRGP